MSVIKIKYWRIYSLRKDLKTLNFCKYCELIRLLLRFVNYSSMNKISFPAQDIQCQREAKTEVKYMIKWNVQLRVVKIGLAKNLANVLQPQKTTTLESKVRFCVFSKELMKSEEEIFNIFKRPLVNLIKILAPHLTWSALAKPFLLTSKTFLR